IPPVTPGKHYSRAPTQTATCFLRPRPRGRADPAPVTTPPSPDPEGMKVLQLSSPPLATPSQRFGNNPPSPPFQSGQPFRRHVGTSISRVLYRGAIRTPKHHPRRGHHYTGAKARLFEKRQARYRTWSYPFQAEGPPITSIDNHNSTIKPTTTVTSRPSPSVDPEPSTTATNFYINTNAITAAPKSPTVSTCTNATPTTATIITATSLALISTITTTTKTVNEATAASIQPRNSPQQPRSPTAKGLSTKCAPIVANVGTTRTSLANGPAIQYQKAKSTQELTEPTANDPTPR
ncbi:mucin-2-like, partial [Glossina fuscipes]|uniref:Mucin-2-like n=1 Tax=Glossina fuscipes TaxID=7396 RepID=A0A9C6DPH2_9MUSC